MKLRIKQTRLLVVLPLLLGSVFAVAQAGEVFAASVASENKAYAESKGALVVLESNLLYRPAGVAPKPRGTTTPHDIDSSCLFTHLDKAYGGC